VAARWRNSGRASPAGHHDDGQHALGLLSAHAIQTAPAGLAAKLAGASLAGAAAKTGTTLTIMTLTSFKTGIIATGIAAGLAVWLVAEHRSLNRLQGENAVLRQQIQLGQPPPPTSRRFP